MAIQTITHNAATSLVHACHSCGEKETADKKMKMCSICKKVYYCNVDCQKKDWKQHKITCQSSETKTDKKSEIKNYSNRIVSDTYSFEKIYQRIESEANRWRGDSKINLNTPSSDLNGLQERKEWWGRYAEKIGSTGLNTLIDQAIPSEPGIALDIGCGYSESAFHLLKKGWTVICIDYSQKALITMEIKAKAINKEWLNNKLKLVCCNIEAYEWPKEVDLILASSALPYFNPKKIQAIMQNIYQSLRPNGNFIGNFFATKYVGDALEATREMGAWFMVDEDNVGYLLAGHGYKVIKCAHGGMQNQHSIVFIGKKPAELKK